jgi:hypothetical protein
MSNIRVYNGEILLLREDSMELIKLKNRCKSLFLTYNETMEIIDNQFHIDYFHNKFNSTDGKRISAINE